MKKAILVLTLVLGLGTTQVSWASAAPKHRYTPATQQVDNGQDAIEAYSDTTSVDTAETTVDDDESATPHHSKYSISNYDDPFDFFGSVFGSGTLVFVLILCIVFGFLFLFAPLIIVFLLVRYLYRRHNDHVKLAEMAMEKGINVPESSRPIDKQSDEYLQKRGLRNAFLGAGLAVMFMIWGSDFMVGIGALVFFYGAGQAVIGALPSIKRWWNERQGRGNATDL